MTVSLRFNALILRLIIALAFTGWIFIFGVINHEYCNH